MSKKLLIVAALAVVGVAGVTFLSGSRSDVYAADDSAVARPVGEFANRVAEILGIEEGQLSDAMDQAVEEGYKPMHRGKQGGMGALTTCTDISLEDLRAAMEESEGQTHGEVLQSLGVSDLEQVSACLLEAKMEGIDQLEESGRVTTEQADQMRADASEFSEDFLNKEIGSRMHLGEGKFGGGRGMGRGPGHMMEGE